MWKIRECIGTVNVFDFWICFQKNPLNFFTFLRNILNILIDQSCDVTITLKLFFLCNVIGIYSVRWTYYFLKILSFNYLFHVTAMVVTSVIHLLCILNQISCLSFSTVVLRSTHVIAYQRSLISLLCCLINAGFVEFTLLLTFQIDQFV